MELFLSKIALVSINDIPVPVSLTTIISRHMSNLIIELISKSMVPLSVLLIALKINITTK